MKPIVWDVFTFHNELLLLEVRKRELRDERFDVRHLPIEALDTFTGEPRERVLDASLVLNGIQRVPPRDREARMRRATAWALDLVGAAPDDYVLFGDVDEIPHGGAIQDAIDADIMDGPDVRCLRMPYHSLLATWRLPLDRDTLHHRFPLIAQRRVFEARSRDWSWLREASGNFHRIDNAGWHLSSMGGPTVVLDKIAAFCHAGEPWTVGLDAERLRDLASRGRDIADRFDQDPVPAWELPFALLDDPVGFGVFLDVAYWNQEPAPL